MRIYVPTSDQVGWWSCAGSLHTCEGLSLLEDDSVGESICVLAYLSLQARNVIIGSMKQRKGKQSTRVLEGESLPCEDRSTTPSLECFLCSVDGLFKF